MNPTQGSDNAWTPVVFDPEACPPPKIPIRLRRYREEDREAVLFLHDINAPDRFPENHRPTLERCLTPARFPRLERFFTRQSHLKLVAESASGKVIACGFVQRNLDQPANGLSYGLIAPEYQGKGIGKTLLFARLVAATTFPGTHFSWINSVPKSIGYYLRFGFQLHGNWKGEDGKLHPSAVLVYSPASLAPIAAQLRERGHRVDWE